MLKLLVPSMSSIVDKSLFCLLILFIRVSAKTIIMDSHKSGDFVTKPIGRKAKFKTLYWLNYFFMLNSNRKVAI